MVILHKSPEIGVRSIGQRGFLSRRGSGISEDTERMEKLMQPIGWIVR